MMIMTATEKKETRICVCVYYYNKIIIINNALVSFLL